MIATVLLLIVLAATLIVSLFAPWVGILAYYLLATLAPQDIWFWAFSGLRVSFLVAVVVIGVFSVMALTNQLSFGVWKCRQNLALIMLWGGIVASFLLGAHPPNNIPNAALNSHYLVQSYSKKFLFYFIAQPFLLDLRRIQGLILVIIVSAGYLTYWANAQYLTGAMFRSAGPGLRGPMAPDGAGLYLDENTFAMVFVIAIPFFFFMAARESRLPVKIVLYLLIPFAWHGVFLTGSRGGLLGLGLVSLHIVLRSRRRFLGTLVAAGLVIAFMTQAGDLMWAKSPTILDYEQDTAASQRLEAWAIGLAMTMDHPLFGVGIGNFTIGWWDYQPGRSRVAHSSIIQLAAEAGVVAAAGFLLLFLFSLHDIRHLRRDLDRLAALNNHDRIFAHAAINAIEGGLLGYFGCGLFLSLETFEIFYVLVLLVVCLRAVVARTASPVAISTGSPPTLVRGIPARHLAGEVQ